MPPCTPSTHSMSHARTSTTCPTFCPGDTAVAAAAAAAEDDARSAPAVVAIVDVGAVPAMPIAAAWLAPESTSHECGSPASSAKTSSWRSVMPVTAMPRAARSLGSLPKAAASFPLWKLTGWLRLSKSAQKSVAKGA